jgi:hypothetical protein
MNTRKSKSTKKYKKVVICPKNKKGASIGLPPSHLKKYKVKETFKTKNMIVAKACITKIMICKIG